MPRREMRSAGGARSMMGLALLLVGIQLAGSQNLEQKSPVLAPRAAPVHLAQRWRGVEDLPNGGTRFLQEDDTASPTQTPGDMPAPVGGPTPSPDETSTTDSPAGSEETPAPANDRSLSTPSPVVEDDGTPMPVEPEGTPAPYAPSTCSDGVTAGVSTGSVCCKEQCGQCGGVGCGSIAGTSGAADCCPSTISTSGTICGEAPCIMEGYTPSPVNPAFEGSAAPVEPSTCSNGQPGYQDQDVCCVESCGQCGGSGCGTIPGTGGSANCCSATIREAGVICGEPPCVLEGYTPAPAVVGGGTAAPAGSGTCSNGIVGWQDGGVCCAANCGQCGGTGCGAVPGTAGSSACCSSIIAVEGQSCDVTGEAPCIIDGYTPAPVVPDYGSAAPVVPSTCSNGMAGYQDLDVCCLEACGQCGGAGCGTIPGTGGNEFCCSSVVRANGQICGNGVEPPCIIDGYTPSPVNPAFVGSAAPFAASTCSNGLAGVQNGAACCVEACGQCGGVGCGTIPGTGGSENCCASSVLAANNICGNGNGNVAPCVIQGYTPAPAGVPGETAPFAPSTCINGMPGVQGGAACCEEKCGQCGGIGCGTINGTAGSESCCSSTIIERGVACGNGVEAPCYFNNYTPAPATIDGVLMPFANSTCTNGFAGVQDAGICCAENCGQCGGVGCGTLPGTGGSSFCCSNTIAVNGTSCQITGEAPCIIDDWVSTPSPLMFMTAAPVVPQNCSNGLAGYQDADICCKMSCGLCGGDGCGKVNGTNGPSDCCPSTIRQNNQTCGGTVVAPCVIPSTPAPTAAPAITPVPTPTPFVSGDADEFINSTANAAYSRLAGPGGVLPFVAAVGAFLGAVAFGAHHSAKDTGRAL